MLAARYVSVFALILPSLLMKIKGYQLSMKRYAKVVVPAGPPVPVEFHSRSGQPHVVDVATGQACTAPCTMQLPGGMRQIRVGTDDPQDVSLLHKYVGMTPIEAAATMTDDDSADWLGLENPDEE